MPDVNLGRMLGAWVVLCASACTPVSPRNGPTEVTVEELAAFPQFFDGRTVQVEGYLLICWEGGGLFSSRAAADAYDFSRGIRVAPARALGESERFWGVYGPVVGTFSAYDGLGELHPLLVVEAVHPRRRFTEYVEPKMGPPTTLEEIDALFEEAVAGARSRPAP